MSRTFRRLKAVFNQHSYFCGPFVCSMKGITPRKFHRAIGDGPKGMWSPPGEFTRQTSTVKLRRYTRRQIHRAMLRENGWDAFTIPRKWPRPYWW